MAAAFLSSCMNEENFEPVQSSKNISFSVNGLSGTSNSQPATRSETGDSLIAIIPLEGNSEKPLYLHIFASDIPETEAGSLQTRSTGNQPISELGEIGDFRVYAYKYDSWDESTATPNFFSSGTNNYDIVTMASPYTDPQSTVKTYGWPGASDSLRFFAIGPDDAFSNLSNDASTGSPVLTYTTPSTSSSHMDIIAASARERGDYKNPVPLNFKHILTGVRFKVDAYFKSCTFTKIEIKCIQSGSYSMKDSTWTLLDSNSQTVISESLDTAANVHTYGTESYLMLDTAKTICYYFVPQVLNGSMGFTYTDTDGASTTVVATFDNDQEWPAGKLITYKISDSSVSIDYTFNVTGPGDYLYLGGTDQYYVESYQTVSNSSGVISTDAVSWTAEFVAENDSGGYDVIEDPAWLTAFTKEGPGSESGTLEYDATVEAQTGDTSDVHTIALRNATAVGDSDDPHDLMTDHNNTTANSYIISAPGYYKLPLVYGNAVTNGVTNRDAYKTGALTIQLDNFVRHDGEAIESPYIYDAFTPASAELLWQDVKNLVKNVGLTDQNSSGKYTYLKFEVPASSIAQGNAVVAVKDSEGTVMWSWHIWVTDCNPGDSLKRFTYSSSSYDLMPVNLGWTDGTTTEFAGRDVKVRFTQLNSGKDTIITINQLDTSLYTVGNCPYYQWGRKDPMLPSVGIASYARGASDVDEADNKTWYDSTGTSNDAVEIYTTTNSGDAFIAECITNPTAFIEKASMDNSYLNLWAVNRRGSQVTAFTDNVKSVYDPCPPGYKVPVMYFEFSLTDDGDNETYLDQVLGTWDNEHKGWNMNCTVPGTSTATTTFFPAGGCRNVTATTIVPVGQSYSVGAYGFYWSSAPNGTAGGYSTSNYYRFRNPNAQYIDGAYIMVNGSEDRGRGFMVRPTKDSAVTE